MKSFLKDQYKHKTRPCSKKEGHNLPENLDRLLWVSPITWVTLQSIYRLVTAQVQDIHGHPSFPWNLMESYLCSPALFLPLCLINNRVFPLISREEAHVPAPNMSHHFPYCCFINVAVCAVTNLPGWGRALSGKPGVWPFKKPCNHFASLSWTETTELCRQISLLKIPKYTLRAKMTFQFAQTTQGLCFWNYSWKLDIYKNYRINKTSNNVTDSEAAETRRGPSRHW